jgi:uncharacterized protein (AIM24 family)
MAVPVPIKTPVANETYGGVVYHIEGELVPALHIELNDMPVYFEHHVLLWKDPSVQITVKALQGDFQRMFLGKPVFMMQTRGPGRIAFSRDGAGYVLPLHLKAGESFDVREHQFLAATENIDVTFARILAGSNSFFIDTFSCARGEGVLWLHGSGNIFQVDLKPGEEIDLEPGSWIYKQETVQMKTIIQTFRESPKSAMGLLAKAGQLSFNCFTGPGHLGLQSMSF